MVRAPVASLRACSSVSLLAAILTLGMGCRTSIADGAAVAGRGAPGSGGGGGTPTGGRGGAGTGGASFGTGGSGTGGFLASGGAGGRASSGGVGPLGGAGGAAASGTGGQVPIDAGAFEVAAPDATAPDGSAMDLVPTRDGGAGVLGGGPVVRSTVHQDIGVHDPSMIWDGKRYYMFATGSSASARSSVNLTQWMNAGRFWTARPAWISTAIGQAVDVNTPWAPDISYFNGKFHLYYCASVFGKNTSVIGLTTNVALDPTTAGYGWVDQGLVIQSQASDNYNAIDPNIAFDAAGVPWLSFGSFWSGIKLRKLDATTGKLAADDPTTYAIASRNGGAIEAPSIVSHNGYYYLFVSFDVCCQNVNSTYRTMVGRAPAITGPYVDKAGKAMLQAGGDQLLTTTGRYAGPGGGSAWKNGDTYLYAYHYYDLQGNGASKLAVRPINFTADDWVTLGEPLFP